MGFQRQILVRIRSKIINFLSQDNNDEYDYQNSSYLSVNSDKRISYKPREIIGKGSFGIVTYILAESSILKKQQLYK